MERVQHLLALGFGEAEGDAAGMRCHWATSPGATRTVGSGGPGKDGPRAGTTVRWHGTARIGGLPDGRVGRGDHRG